MSESVRFTVGAGSCDRCGRPLRASQHEEQESGLCLLCLNGPLPSSPADTYRRHAVPLSAAEQALWDRPAAPESVTHQLAKVLRIADLNGAAVVGFDDGETAERSTAVSGPETWRPIPGYADRYEASSGGRIRWSRSTPRFGDQVTAWVWETYPIVSLKTPEKRFTVGVHRLVCMAFHGPPEPKQEARHLNGVPTDNRAENLAWGSRRDQRLDDVRNGVQRQAASTTCIRGHAYDAERERSGQRRCSTCRRRLVPCPGCGSSVTASNLYRHKRDACRSPHETGEGA